MSEHLDPGLRTFRNLLILELDQNLKIANWIVCEWGRSVFLSRLKLLEYVTTARKVPSWAHVLPEESERAATIISTQTETSRYSTDTRLQWIY